MTNHSARQEVPTPRGPVLQWLLDSDPSIRWQAMRDFTAASDQDVAAERAKVATEGWGARLLVGQDANGLWGSGTRNPEWVTLKALLLLRDMGLDPASEPARCAVARVRENVKWRGMLPQDAAWHDKPLFVGEVEPCINGRVVTAGAYFGEDVRGIVERLLGEQLSDGGWNCEQERGSTRGSFHTTICVLEGLLEYEQTTGMSPAVTAARTRGQDYLLQRRLLRRLSTGDVIDDAWIRLSYPCGYHYDVLRALEYLRGADGRWPLEHRHSEELDAEPGVSEGQASRWNTLRALRVLDGHPVRA